MRIEGMFFKKQLLHSFFGGKMIHDFVFLKVQTKSIIELI